MQLSIFFNIEEGDPSKKFSTLVATISTNRMELMHCLDTGCEAALVKCSVIKRFAGHGHFRGTVQSYDGEFFSNSFLKMGF